MSYGNFYYLWEYLKVACFWIGILLIPVEHSLIYWPLFIIIFVPPHNHLIINHLFYPMNTRTILSAMLAISASVFAYGAVPDGWSVQPGDGDNV